MARKKDSSRPEHLDENIRKELDAALDIAESYFVTKKEDIPPFAIENLDQRFIDALELMAKYCEKASGGYSNLITSLSIKAVYGDKVDVRYHQVQIQNQTDRPAGFNFRGVSETTIYEWMEEHEFHGAKSGWQTRTFERPKPYMLTYDENIGSIKEPFLICYDELETMRQNASVALAFLLWRRLQLREATKVELAIPKIQDVLQITRLFETHFFYKYKDSKGASRLPVLALYAVYKVLLKEIGRYDGKQLKELEAHSAADAQTGAIGDIEIVRSDDGAAFEAVEVKHGLIVTKAMVESAKQKIRGSQVDRYYILTTHSQHEPSEEVLQEVENVKKLLGCQMIVNGVVPTLKYYLRLLTNPGAVLPAYAEVLAKDGAIGFEHRDVWNRIATGIIKI
jgi:DNA (cytosine-5)-methyltransferase 1